MPDTGSGRPAKVYIRISWPINSQCFQTNHCTALGGRLMGMFVVKIH